MNIREFMDRRAPEIDPVRAKRSTKKVASRREVTSYVFAQSSEDGIDLGALTEYEFQDQMSSKKFHLLQVPVNKIAATKKLRSSLVYRFKAEVETKVPIVIDLNKGKERTSSGFKPKAIVMFGAERFEAAGLRGDTHVLAWVGASAATKLELHCDDDMSSDELQEKLSKILRDKYVKNVKRGLQSPGYAYDNSPTPWISVVYPFEDYFIYRYDNKTYRQHYTIDQAARTVAFKGAPIEVISKYVDKDAKDPLHASGNSSIENAMKCDYDLSAGGPGSGRHKELDSTALSHGYKYSGTALSPYGDIHIYRHPSDNRYGTAKATITTRSDGSWTHKTNPNKGDSVFTRGNGSDSLHEHLSKVPKSLKAGGIKAGGLGSGRHSGFGSRHDASKKVAEKHGYKDKGYSQYGSDKPYRRMTHHTGEELHIAQNGSWSHEEKNGSNSKSLDNHLTKVHGPINNGPVNRSWPHQR